MSNKWKIISSQFRAANRFANYGPVLTKMKISGFRGIRNFEISFDNPITALCGTNGCGKSTISQLAACGYKKIATEPDTKRYYVKDFIKVSQLDPAPIDSDAFIEYHYATTQPTRAQVVTVSRGRSEWSGYKRQPERVVWYVGFTLYIPKVERKDFSVYQALNLTIGESRSPSENAIYWTNKILGNEYDQADFTSVSHQNKQTEVGRLIREGTQYSESNMGFGEGRVLYLIDLIENSPINSLIVLEEPETSLHPVAQYNLSQYLLDVAERKKHQIILSTHSENLLSGLPPESRKFLIRRGNSIETISGISTTHAISFLTGNYNPALTICVEDEFAKEVLTEIIRKVNHEILGSIKIQPIGDSRAVAQATEYLNLVGKNTIGIRDADKGEDKAKKLFKLPGSQPPEKEVLQLQAVKDFLQTQYHVSVDSFLRQHPELNHHSYYKELSKMIHVRVGTLETECIRCYVNNIEEADIQSIFEVITSNL